MRSTASCAILLCLIAATQPAYGLTKLATKAKKIAVAADFKLEQKGNAEALAVAPKVEAEWVSWDTWATVGFTTTLYYARSEIDAGDAATTSDTFGFSLAKLSWKKIGDKNLRGGPFLTLGAEYLSLEKTSPGSVKEEEFWSPAVAFGIDLPIGKKFKLATVYATNLREGERKNAGLKAGLSFDIKSEVQTKQ